MFDGYVKTKDKKPLETRKNRNVYQLKIENCDFGGILSEDIVMIDLDDITEFNNLFWLVEKLNISCNVLKTSRGGHFYFNNTHLETNKIGSICPLGLTIDVKLGKKNTVVPLKINGLERKFIRFVDELDDLPIWLYPVKIFKYKFYEMDAGVRNQELFNYILHLQDCAFTVDEIKEIIRIVNMLLPESLGEEELKTILRKDSFKKESFYKGKTFLFNKFAKYMLKNNNVTKINGLMYCWDYKDKTYTKNVEKVMLDYIDFLNHAKRQEVTRYLELISNVSDLSEFTNFIKLNNGIYDIKNNKLLEISKHKVIINSINVNYIPEAYCSIFDDMLNKITCENENIRKLIEEMFGYMLYRKNSLGKAFFLIGEGSNGKSTLISILKKFFKSENYNTLEMDELNDKFRLAELNNKLVNFGEDISNKFIHNSSKFKKLCTGESMLVERKNVNPFEMSGYVKMVFSANELPKINDFSRGYLRRLTIIPFNAVFTSNDVNYDPNILDKFDDNTMSYILNLAIEGLNRILLNKKFTNEKAVEEQLKSYEISNNPILNFVENGGFKIDHEMTQIVFDNFNMFCVKSNITHFITISKFTKELSKLGYKNKVIKINGKTYRHYVSYI